jgi:phage shock protein A
MRIMTRFIRLCKADIHGVMDQLEDRKLMLKQSLRDMADEIRRKEAKIASLRLSLTSAVQNHVRYQAEIKKMEKEIETAIEKEKDDIARFLIKKFKPIEIQQMEIANNIDVLENEIKRRQMQLEEQCSQYEMLLGRSKQYFRTLVKLNPDDRYVNIFSKNEAGETSEEEVELELLRRKETWHKEKNA